MTDFITSTELVDYLGRGDPEDPGVAIAVAAACGIVRSYADQDFTFGTATDTLDGTGTDALILRRLPVNTVGTVTVAGSAVTDYVLGSGGILFRKASGVDVDYSNQVTTLAWPVGRQNVAVTYVHGYLTATMPQDVRAAAFMVAARLAVQGVAIQESVGDVSIRYGVNSTDLTDGEKALLRKYRRI